MGVEIRISTFLACNLAHCAIMVFAETPVHSDHKSMLTYRHALAGPLVLDPGTITVYRQAL